jgi:hypothetical protein
MWASTWTFTFQAFANMIARCSTEFAIALSNIQYLSALKVLALLKLKTFKAKNKSAKALQKKFRALALKRFSSFWCPPLLKENI